MFRDLTVYNIRIGLDKWEYIEDSLHHNAHELQGRDHLDHYGALELQYRCHTYDHAAHDFKVVAILIIMAHMNFKVVEA